MAESSKGLKAGLAPAGAVDADDADKGSFFSRHKKVFIIPGAFAAAELIGWTSTTLLSKAAANHILLNIAWLGHTLNLAFIGAEALTAIGFISAFIASKVKDKALAPKVPATEVVTDAHQLKSGVEAPETAAPVQPPQEKEKVKGAAAGPEPEPEPSGEAIKSDGELTTD